MAYDFTIPLTILTLLIGLLCKPVRIVSKRQAPANFLCGNMPGSFMRGRLKLSLLPYEVAESLPVFLSQEAGSRSAGRET